MSDKTYEKLETENPILDEIVYNCKLMMKTCLLKDEVAANNAETAESARNADLYKAIIEKRAKIYNFDITIDDCRDAYVPSYYTKRYLGTPDKFPQVYIDKLIEIKSKQFMDSFVEKNNYYRKICGLPDYGDKGIFLKDEHFQGKNIYINIDTSIPVHEMTLLEKQTLKDVGIIDMLNKENPDKYYLKHLTKEIDLFTARDANNFELLYVDQSCEHILVRRFKELMEKNRVYMGKVFDFKSYRFYSTYYNRFVMLMIVAQTVIDMISEIPEYFIRRDVFDIRTCEYFFEANGVEFFPEIPLKYQKKLIQNLNKLIKFKSTEKNIVDICSIFGFENIKIFKYYLMKIHNKDDDGKFISKDERDIEEVYDLKFVKVPLIESVNDYYRNETNLKKYDNIVYGDEYWNGPYDHRDIKRQILQHEFNIVQSKYISIDTVYNLTEISFQMTYFLNMLFYSGIDSKSVSLIVPDINQDIKLPFIDVFMFLFALMYNYLGVEDVIADEPSQYLTVKGFNFEADLGELAAYVAEKGFTLEELGVDGFTIPENGILTLPQMIATFVNNKKVFNHLQHQLWNAENKRIYDIYKYLYDSLMVCELNYSNFYIPSIKRQASSYSEWLYYNNSIIYSVLLELKRIKDKDERRTTIYNIMNNVSQRILDWMNTEELDDIFSQFPIENSNYIKQYMQKIINFFKSYRITLLELNNIYTFDEEKIIMIDDAFVSHIYDKWELIKTVDIFQKLIATYRMDENVDIKDLLSNIEYTRTYSRELIDSADYNTIKDRLAKIVSCLNTEEYIHFNEHIKAIYRTFYTTRNEAVINTDILAEIILSLNKKENINAVDMISNIKYYKMYSKEFIDIDYTFMRDSLAQFQSSLYANNSIIFNDTIKDIHKLYSRKNIDNFLIEEDCRIETYTG